VITLHSGTLYNSFQIRISKEKKRFVNFGSWDGRGIIKYRLSKQQEQSMEFTASFLAIERDVHSRRHARQPFEDKYTALTLGPMNTRDDQGQDKPREIQILAREVKLRSSIIQVAPFSNCHFSN